jgi:hypothetical protein
MLLAIAMAWTAGTAPVIWGGQGIELRVSDAGAELDLDCASGTIDEAIKPDAKGAFSAKGHFSAEHPGPVRSDEVNGVKAIYSGTITGDTMALKIALEGKDAPKLEFELTRGKNGRIHKCR